MFKNCCKRPVVRIMFILAGWDEIVRLCVSLFCPLLLPRVKYKYVANDGDLEQRSISSQLGLTRSTGEHGT